MYLSENNWTCVTYEVPHAKPYVDWADRRCKTLKINWFLPAAMHY